MRSKAMKLEGLTKIGDSYGMILKERGGTKSVVVMIGTLEAAAIAFEYQRIDPPRPLTHHLTKSIIEKTGARLAYVLIKKVEEGVFHAELCGDFGKTGVIDSRASDAVALALSMDKPILMNEEIINESGIEIEFEKRMIELEESQDSKESRYDSMSLDELNDELNEAIRSEDYEKAAPLRDAIKKRKNNQ